MDYVKLFDDFDKIATEKLYQLVGSPYLQLQQLQVYFIGRVNEAMLELYPDIKLRTDLTRIVDYHDWEHRYSIWTDITVNGKTHHYAIKLIHPVGNKTFRIVRTRPPVAIFQSAVAEQHKKIINELSGNSWLSSAELIGLYNEQMNAYLNSELGIAEPDASITLSHGANRISYVATVSDPATGEKLKFTSALINGELVLDPPPSDEEQKKKVRKERADLAVNLSTDISNLLEETYLTTEKESDARVVEVGEKFLTEYMLKNADTVLNYQVESNTADGHRVITFWVEAITDVKIRIRATRKILEPTEN